MESCPTLELPGDEVVGRLGDYVFGSGENENDVILLLGYGMLYNHSYEANLRVRPGRAAGDHVRHAPAVEPGEELTIDYGEEWWSTRNLEPT